MKNRYFFITIATFLVAFLFTLMPFTSEAAQTFPDVTKHWARSNITTAVREGWIKGFPSGKFYPNSGVKRGEAITMITQVTGTPSVYRTSWTFKDISKHWANFHIESGIWRNYLVSSDYLENLFRPDQSMTRQETVIMLVRVLGLNNLAESQQGTDLPFKDTKDIPNWVRGFVKQGYENGIIKGYPDGLFHGESQVSRAEAVVMIHKMLEAKQKIYPETVTVNVNMNLNNESQSHRTVVINSKAVNQDGRLFIPIQIISVIGGVADIYPDKLNVVVLGPDASVIPYNYKDTRIDQVQGSDAFVDKSGEMMLPIDVVKLFGTYTWDNKTNTLAVTEISNIIAEVNGEMITKGVLDSTVAKIQRSLIDIGEDLSGENGKLRMEAIRKQSLDELVIQTLIVQDAAKQGIIISEEELDSAMIELKKKFGDEKRFADALALYGYTEQEIRRLKKFDMIRQALYEKVAGGTNDSVQKEKVFTNYLDGLRRTADIKYY